MEPHAEAVPLPCARLERPERGRAPALAVPREMRLVRRDAAITLAAKDGVELAEERDETSDVLRRPRGDDVVVGVGRRPVSDGSGWSRRG